MKENGSGIPPPGDIDPDRHLHPIVKLLENLQGTSEPWKATTRAS
jgi:hypothetical protein